MEFCLSEQAKNVGKFCPMCTVCTVTDGPVWAWWGGGTCCFDYRNFLWLPPPYLQTKAESKYEGLILDQVSSRLPKIVIKTCSKKSCCTVHPTEASPEGSCSECQNSKHTLSRFFLQRSLWDSLAVAGRYMQAESIYCAHTVLTLTLFFLILKYCLFPS